MTALLGIYAIVDDDLWASLNVNLAADSVLEPLVEVLCLSACAIQLRAKHASATRTISLLHRMRPICHRAAVPLVVNDRADFARVVSADFCHVGIDDLPIDAVRAVAPGVRVGSSTHTQKQLEDTLSQRPDYVAYGPVFMTTSKQSSDKTVGITALAMAVTTAKNSAIPCVAIGGIRESNLTDVLSSGVQSVAMISEITMATNNSPDLELLACKLARLRQLIESSNVA